MHDIIKEYISSNNTQILDKSDSEFSETDSDGVENEIEPKLSKKNIACYTWFGEIYSKDRSSFINSGRWKYTKIVWKFL